MQTVSHSICPAVTGPASRSIGNLCVLLAGMYKTGRQQLYEKVLTRLRTIGAGGGLILGPTHHVQIDTPLENFWVMVNTIRETRYDELS